MADGAYASRVTGAGVRPMRLLVVGLLLVPLALAHAQDAPRNDAALASDDSISVLSYNIHGLFPLIAKDNPRDRIPTIGWLARRYDVVLFQEDFEYHDVLHRQLAQHVGFQGNGMGWDPRRVAVKALLLPVSLPLPYFSPPYGAGLSTFVHEDFARTGDSGRKAYDSCYGWFGDHGDCWSRKGFLRVAMETLAGLVDIYNTHLEAGSSRRSVEVRGQQLEKLATAIKERSDDRAIIVAGDFNISFNRSGDADIMRRFRRRLGLDDSGAGPVLASWRERDYILYRSGPDIRLVVEASGEAMEFISERHALSDHAALYARFRVDQMPPNAP